MKTMQLNRKLQNIILSLSLVPVMCNDSVGEVSIEALEWRGL